MFPSGKRVWIELPKSFYLSDVVSLGDILLCFQFNTIIVSQFSSLRKLPLHNVHSLWYSLLLLFYLWLPLCTVFWDCHHFIWTAFWFSLLIRATMMMMKIMVFWWLLHASDISWIFFLVCVKLNMWCWRVNRWLWHDSIYMMKGKASPSSWLFCSILCGSFHACLRLLISNHTLYS